MVATADFDKLSQNHTKRLRFLLSNPRITRSVSDSVRPIAEAHDGFPILIVQSPKHNEAFPILIDQSAKHTKCFRFLLSNRRSTWRVSDSYCTIKKSTSDEKVVTMSTDVIKTSCCLDGTRTGIRRTANLYRLEEKSWVKVEKERRILKKFLPLWVRWPCWLLYSPSVSSSVEPPSVGRSHRLLVQTLLVAILYRKINTDWNRFILVTRLFRIFFW